MYTCIQSRQRFPMLPLQIWRRPSPSAATATADSATARAETEVQDKA